MSQEFTPKKIREPIDCYEESTWLANGTPVFEDSRYAIWEDRFPVTPGHLLFIHKRNDILHIRIAYGEAYSYGEKKIESGE